MSTKAKLVLALGFVVVLYVLFESGSRSVPVEIESDGAEVESEAVEA